MPTGVEKPFDYAKGLPEFSRHVLATDPNESRIDHAVIDLAFMCGDDSSDALAFSANAVAAINAATVALHSLKLKDDGGLGWLLHLAWLLTTAATDALERETGHDALALVPSGPSVN